MPRKAISSNSSLGKALIKTKQKKRFNQRKDDEPMGGYKVVSNVISRDASHCLFLSHPMPN